MANCKIGRLTIGMAATNCYFVYEEGKKEVIVFDPADKGGYIYDQLLAKGFEVAAIVLTHGHFDHIWGVEELKAKSGAKVYAYEGEKRLLENVDLNVSAQVGRPCAVCADVYVSDREMLTLAGITFEVIATPGHTEGSCCFYFKDDGFLISGDTLFEESVGRTDLATGSMSALVRSIRERLLPLPDDTRVFPGHGAPTTIGHEKEYNEFII